MSDGVQQPVVERCGSQAVQDPPDFGNALADLVGYLVQGGGLGIVTTGLRAGGDLEP